MEYLFFAGGMIYFVIAAIGILAVPIIKFFLTIILTVKWEIEKAKETNES